MGGEDRTGHGSARVQASSAERQADGFLVGVCVGKLEGYFRLADSTVPFSELRLHVALFRPSRLSQALAIGAEALMSNAS